MYHLQSKSQTHHVLSISHKRSSISFALKILLLCQYFGHIVNLEVHAHISAKTKLTDYCTVYIMQLFYASPKTRRPSHKYELNCICVFPSYSSKVFKYQFQGHLVKFFLHNHRGQLKQTVLISVFPGALSLDHDSGAWECSSSLSLFCYLV